MSRKPEIIGLSISNSLPSQSQRESNMCNLESFSARICMPVRALLMLLVLTGVVDSAPLQAQEHPLIGSWRINEELSDDPDERVEAAIIEAGGRVQRKWFGREEKERYRGGPAEQELYDRITYDPILRIDYTEPEFWFGYADGYQRVFHSDGRTRSVAANEHYTSGGEDFSLAEWQGETLVVELDKAGFAVASGAACSSASTEPSATLLAMGVAPDSARGAVRLSVGAATKAEEIDAFLQALAKTAGRLRQLTAMAV